MNERKNIVLCLRISSDGQRDGQSLPAQERILTEHANRNDWNVVVPPDSYRVVEDDKGNREIYSGFAFVETASKVKKRTKYNAMLDWIKQNRERLNIGGVLFHQLDRSLRNLYDAWYLPSWAEKNGVKILFASGNIDLDTPEGRLMWNIMASVASYQPDNLSKEVLKGMEQKILSGWWPHLPKFGYVNAKDPEAAVQIAIDQRKAMAARRMFEAYDAGRTVYEIREELRALGFKMSIQQILNCLRSRFYIGEFVWHNRIFQGKHEPLIDRQLWQRVQDRLAGRVAQGRGGRGHGPSLDELPLGGGLIRSRLDGSVLTGERPAKKKPDGTVIHHYYYRTNRPKEGKAIRWNASALEEAVAVELDKLTLPENLRELFKEKLKTELEAESQYSRSTVDLLHKRQGEAKARMDRLLNAFLDGTVDRDAYSAKKAELQREMDGIKAELAKEETAEDQTHEDIFFAFEMTQGLGKTFRSSNSARKRRILEAVCLNLEADHAKIYMTWRCPFGSLVFGDEVKSGGRYWT